MSCIKDDPRFAELERNKNLLGDQLQTRGNEFKKATQNYLQSLSRELNIFCENNEKYDKRNASFKNDIDNIMTRYRISIGNISKANDRLNYEKEKINGYIIKNFSQISNKVKETLRTEKDNIEKIIDAELDYRKLPPQETGLEHQQRRKIEPKDKPFVTNYHDLYNNVNGILGDLQAERAREFAGRERKPQNYDPSIAENRGNYLNFMDQGENSYQRNANLPNPNSETNAKPDYRRNTNDIGRLSERIDREYSPEIRPNLNSNVAESNRDNILKRFLEEGQPSFLPRVSEGDFKDPDRRQAIPQSQFETFHAKQNSNFLGPQNEPVKNNYENQNNFMVGSNVKNTDK